MYSKCYFIWAQIYKKYIYKILYVLKKLKAVIFDQAVSCLKDPLLNSTEIWTQFEVHFHPCPGEGWPAPVPHGALLYKLWTVCNWIFTLHWRSEAWGIKQAEITWHSALQDVPWKLRSVQILKRRKWWKPFDTDLMIMASLLNTLCESVRAHYHFRGVTRPQHCHHRAPPLFRMTSYVCASYSPMSSYLEIAGHHHVRLLAVKAILVYGNIHMEGTTTLFYYHSLNGASIYGLFLSYCLANKLPQANKPVFSNGGLWPITGSLEGWIYFKAEAYVQPVLTLNLIA